jgi:TM2 domain-containing membrane protein YozV
MGLLGDVVNAFEVPKKGKGSAYGSLIFLGLLGWHEFYLGKKLRGVLYIIGFILLMYGWNMAIVPLAYISAGALVVFFLFDLFTLGKQVDKWNAENAGNVLLDTAGSVAGSALSIPLNNAVEEYNGVVANYQDAIKRFNSKKSKVEGLLKNLQKGRKDALAAVKRMEELLTKVRIEGTEVEDVLGSKGELAETFRELLSGNTELFDEIDATIETTSQEMTATFYSANEWTKTIESNVGKYIAVAQTALTVISEFSKQQEKIAELKTKREEILKNQNEVENKIMQLEATQKRAKEILKVINAEIPGFNHIYDGFYAAVFPDGVTEQKELSTLTLEQRKMFGDLGQALSKVLAVIKQEIN